MPRTSSQACAVRTPGRSGRLDGEDREDSGCRATSRPALASAPTAAARLGWRDPRRPSAPLAPRAEAWHWRFRPFRAARSGRPRGRSCGASASDPRRGRYRSRDGPPYVESAGGVAPSASRRASRAAVRIALALRARLLRAPVAGVPPPRLGDSIPMPVAPPRATSPSAGRPTVPAAVLARKHPDSRAFAPTTATRGRRRRRARARRAARVGLCDVRPPRARGRVRAQDATQRARAASRRAASEAGARAPRMPRFPARALARPPPSRGVPNTIKFRNARAPRGRRTARRARARRARVTWFCARRRAGVHRRRARARLTIRAERAPRSPSHCCGVLRPTATMRARSWPGARAPRRTLSRRREPPSPRRRERRAWRRARASARPARARPWWTPSRRDDVRRARARRSARPRPGQRQARAAFARVAASANRASTRAQRRSRRSSAAARSADVLPGPRRPRRRRRGGRCRVARCASTLFSADAAARGAGGRHAAARASRGGAGTARGARSSRAPPRDEEEEERRVGRGAAATRLWYERRRACSTMRRYAHYRMCQCVGVSMFLRYTCYLVTSPREPPRAPSAQSFARASASASISARVAKTVGD